MSASSLKNFLSKNSINQDIVLYSPIAANINCTYSLNGLTDECVTREKKIRERQRGAWPGPFSRSAHWYLAGEGRFGHVTVAVSWQDV